jgi:hypothetical protein
MLKRVEPQDSDGDGSPTSEDDIHRTNSEERQIRMPNDELEEDMFGMTTCALVLDFHNIAMSKSPRLERYLRLSTTLMLLALCVGVQIFLLYEIKRFVSAKAVRDIRLAYDAFEEHMYSELTLTQFGNHRGVDGTFDASQFASLDEDTQAAACRIPLSQPAFFFTVLFIWTITCFYELKQCISMFQSLIIAAGHTDTMRDALEKVAETDGNDGLQDYIIAYLTPAVKAAITLLVIIPRIGITLYLLWLGCRWLLATNSFENLILNAVALAFVLDLKEVLYFTLVPARNKLDLENTKIKPEQEFVTSGITDFTATIAWGIVAAMWVILYMGIPSAPWPLNGLQEVLPDYKWDIHAVCNLWYKWRYCVEPPCAEELVTG